MSTILDKIAEIENEMARTQKNKATSGHLGMLKAKLAKLKRELITPKAQGGGTQEGDIYVHSNRVPREKYFIQSIY